MNSFFKQPKKNKQKNKSMNFMTGKIYLAFDAEIIFLIEFRALDATKMGDSTACFFSLIFFTSDFSRSICVLLSVRLPRFIDVFAAAAAATAAAAAAVLELVALLHGDRDCVHLVDARERFRQMIRGVIVVVGVVAVAVVVIRHSRTLPLRASISANV